MNKGMTEHVLHWKHGDLLIPRVSQSLPDGDREVEFS